MTFEVGPSLCTIDTAVFNASELTLVPEMILFVVASSPFSFIFKTVRSDNSTEIAVREAAPVVIGLRCLG